MAQKLGGNYKTHEDIPVAWQNEILIPYLLEKGVFLNMLDEEEFIRPAWKDTLKLLNILGDSVAIDYMPVDRAVCSNGIAYDYENFVISDSLFSGRSRFEGEALVREVGVNKFTWRDSVKLISDQSFAPLRQYIPGASKDSILSVSFNKGYNQRFIVEFKTRNLFPRRYRVVVRTQMDIGGKYDIYTNNQLARSFDYYDYIRYRGFCPVYRHPSVLPRKDALTGLTSGWKTRPNMARRSSASNTRGRRVLPGTDWSSTILSLFPINTLPG